ncbi:hypothetical protein HY29_04685 [Hyphomonas beringensis]|uniref:Prepilin type IV endopeptidase peptidase domain-containing protein n=1 Tax=Hyphomonas beringensis TaxID=1280946 RepID=A0A062U7G1_9PROT|nr:A24 family peptidase [Hyphomonas beringensis]KCZ52579.1 hypothetical protein HY29_04685 [Hyphomonas beringensis]
MTRNALLILASLALLSIVAISAIAFVPNGPLLWFSLGLGALLVALSIIDLRTLTLPDALNLAVLILGALMVWLTRPDAWPHHLIGAFAGYTLLVMVEITYRQMRGRDGLGRGDAKLLGALGMWTGWAGLAPIMLVASVCGLLAVGILSLTSKRTFDSTSAIAFGPFIALGGWIVWLGADYLLPAGLY